MTRNSRLRRLTPLISVAFAISAACSAAAIAMADAPPAAVPAPAPAPVPVPVPPTGVSEPLRITALLDGATHESASGHARLHRTLRVVLSRAPNFTADHYTLLLNGTEVKSLSVAADGVPAGPAQTGTSWLDFRLERNPDNDAVWRQLLGSPRGLTVAVDVSLRETPPPGCEHGPAPCGPPATILASAHVATIDFVVFTTPELILALVATLIVIAIVWGNARTRATLRDNLLPQLEPSTQPYSLGRWQMTFWFTLIFCSFVVLYVLLGDYNTITAQSLLLMGISGATALASVGVDAAKDSPADAANRGLKALGLSSYDDVLRVEQEIKDREDKLSAEPAPSVEQRAQWQAEIQDRNNVLRMYRDKTRPFLTQGWFRDITTDFNGTAVHRVQAVCWTFLLGIVFVVGVYNDLAMPQFSGMVLALLGISGAGYVGFKIPESNN
jgi:hypothetical protein